jgi:hypothetical protein
LTASTWRRADRFDNHTVPISDADQAVPLPRPQIAASSYFGLIAGFPSGVPGGGGITGILSVEGADIV